jgi:dephospho-CoA kinase
MPIKKSTKIILGLVGEIASGKDTVADYLKKKYGGTTISFSQPLREILDILYLPYTRENMSTLGNTLRKDFGQDLLSRVIADKVKSSKIKIISLPNVRLESDIVYLKKEPGFVLVRVDCDTKTRFDRLKARRQNADDKSKTWKQFLADAKLYTEKHIRELGAQAKYSLDNNGDKKNLYRQIDELIKKIR